MNRQDLQDDRRFDLPFGEITETATQHPSAKFESEPQVQLARIQETYKQIGDTKGCS